MIVGATLITLLNQLIYFGRPLMPKYLVPQAITGLFVMFPASIYGALTVKRQDVWATRGYDKTGGALTIVAAALASMAIIGALLIAVFAQEGEYV
jgi:hypothetical protein